MPRQLLEIKDFKGINYQVDSVDAPPNTALYSEDVDFYSEVGVLEGRIADQIVDINNDDTTTSNNQDINFIDILSNEQGVTDIAYIDETDNDLKVLPAISMENTEPISGDIVDITTDSSMTDYKENASVVKNQSIHFCQANDIAPAEPKWLGYLSYGQYWHDSGAVPDKTPSNYYLSHDECKTYSSHFTISVGQSNSAVSQGIISGYKYFYKFSLVYDGYQESPLFEPDNGTSNGIASGTNSMHVSLELSGTKTDLSRRISHINVYRAYAVNGSTSNVPETPYRYLRQRNFSSIWQSGTDTIAITDNGIASSSYEAITGINEVVENTSINYGVSTTGNDFHFVGAGTQSDIGDAKNYIFKSKAFKYSVFDWSVDFLILPETPTALEFWNGRLYAFGQNTIYRIEPNNFYVEDIFHGAGACHHKATIVTEYGMFHFDNNHVYLNNGQASVPISAPVEFTNQNTVLGDYSENLSKFSFSYMTSSVSNNGDDLSIGYNPQNNSIFIIHNSSGSKALVYSLSQKNWHSWHLPYVSETINVMTTGNFISKGVAFVCTKQVGTSGEGGVYAINSPAGIDDNTQVATRLPFKWVSNKLAFGNNSQKKSILKIDSDKSDDATIKAVIINNYDITEFDSQDTWTDIDSLTLPQKFNALQIMIDGTNEDRLSSVSLMFRTLRGTPT